MTKAQQRTNETAALLSRNYDEPIAWLSQPLLPLNNVIGDVGTEQFLSHVHALAAQLPFNQSDSAHCINLCHNRYLFMVTFCAVIVRQQTNLLPSNKNVATQDRLHQRYNNSYTVHDGLTEIADKVVVINLQDLDLTTTQNDEIPQINLSHIAAISFTSGSTGDAKAIIKTWKTFVASTALNARYMLPNLRDNFYHVATVPSQHMWGLETTVLMALLANACLVDVQPFYPPDIYSILDQLPSPKGLITTPLHLRALNASGPSDTELENVLVATAPLSEELAQSIEQKLSTQIREVYGCSEVGSMSVRRPAESEQWTRFDRLIFTVDKDGVTTVNANHLTESVVLDDQIKMLDKDRFLLTGRTTDQINIAGKRGSLAEVNKILMRFPDLIDGVVIFPPQDRAVPRLVALVVLPSESGKDDLRKHFATYLDAVFVPRPIFLLQQLPRSENGKFIKTELLELYEKLK